MCHTRKPLPYKPKQSHGTLPIKPALKSLSPKHGDNQQPSASILFCTTTGGTAGRKGFPIFLPTWKSRRQWCPACDTCSWQRMCPCLQRAPLAFPSHSRRRKHCLGWILGLLLFMRFPSHHNISINKKSEKRKTAEICFLSFVFGTEC